jgi:microcystin-dependent protein
MTSYCRRPANFAAHERPTIGDTKFSFTEKDHLGWLKCDGTRLLNKSEYGLLYNVIGDTFNSGGEASTQFRIPDPKGRVIGVVGSGAGLTPRDKGDSLGTETHTLIINEMPAHMHGSADVSGNTNGNGSTSTNGDHFHSGTTNGGGFGGTHNVIGSGGVGTDTADNEGSHTHGFQTNTTGDHFHTMGSTGGGAAHNNMQPTLFYGNMFIYCGKVNEGYFPYKTNTDLF